MVRSFQQLCALALASWLTTAITGCSQSPAGISPLPQAVAPQAQSSTQTVNIPHTPVKWQSIGNCWAYAAVGWIESMLLRGETEPLPNFSETYITYRHYEAQLAYLNGSELQTGGSFYEATQIIMRYGLLKESDFAPEEAQATRSERQKKATAVLNESLKSGVLSKSRTREVIRAELDRAFGVNMKALESKVIDPSTITVSAGRGVKAPLSEVMPAWREIHWPISYAEYPADPRPGFKAEASWDGKLTEMQVRALRRAMRAMNAGYPVVLNWFVDFNAMTPEGVFDLKKLQEAGVGRQGYHSTVLEDYLAKGFDPVTNTYFETPEGEVSDLMKTAAVSYGALTSFITKNSWGGSERIDRSSYFRDGEKGYHKLQADYLFAFIPQYNEETQAFEGFTTGINSLIVPPGF
ncbi:MAG: hypothetical protein RI932_2218 [Pseudomonadota bacterium]